MLRPNNIMQLLCFHVLVFLSYDARRQPEPVADSIDWQVALLKSVPLRLYANTLIFTKATFDFLLDSMRVSHRKCVSILLAG
jgi:hypothetical protein